MGKWWSWSMSTRPARVATTGPSWSMSKVGGRWTCYPTGRRPAWPPGSRNGQGSRWSAAIAHRSSPKAPPSGHPGRCKWQAGGISGSYQRVRAYFRKKRLSPGPVNSSAAVTPRRRRMDSPPARVPDGDRPPSIQAILVHCPELDALTGHVRPFGQVLTERQGERLPQWLDAVRQDDLPSLHTLAACGCSVSRRASSRLQPAP